MEIWTMIFVLGGAFGLLVGGHALFIIYHNFLIVEMFPLLHMLTLIFCVVLMVFARMKMESELNRTK